MSIFTLLSPKRLLDLLLAVCLLLLLWPLILLIALCVWCEDRDWPFFTTTRGTQEAQPFQLIKIRTMLRGADRQGPCVTAENDRRITRLGRFLRTYKLDELTQLWHIMVGQMSFVGPRPNVFHGIGGIDDYTPEEKKLLTLKPGLTDLASLVFSQEGHLLANATNVETFYNEEIRPLKLELGLFYLRHHSLRLDLHLLVLTPLSLLRMDKGYPHIKAILERYHAPYDLRQKVERIMCVKSFPV